jgi:hypothetical protein
LGSNSKKIDESRQTFDKKMKDPTSAGKIKKLKEANMIATKLSENVEACCDWIAGHGIKPSSLCSSSLSAVLIFPTSGGKSCSSWLSPRHLGEYKNNEDGVAWLMCYNYTFLNLGNPRLGAALLITYLHI